MLLTSLTCLEDGDIAERMRTVARRMGCGNGIVEQAADEAVAVYQASRNSHAALNAGVEFILGVKAEQRQAGKPERTPFAWVESWPVIIGALIVTALLAVANAAGLLQ